MQANSRRVVVCNCRQTMTLDGGSMAATLATAEPFVHTELCRAQLENFRAACRTGEPLLIGCTQEAPLFAEIAGEAGAGDLAFVNIRERAGWSDEGRRATAKMAALIAEAALDLQPTPAVTLKSDGVALVYGAGETALAAARRLAQRLNVTCLLTRADDALPPRVMDFPVFRGTVRQAKGHLGAFEVAIDGFAAAMPSSRAALAFDPGRDGAVSNCDVILDLSGGASLFAASARRDGYLRVEPSDKVALERALFEIADLVGEFEKPRYARLDPAICAHSRNGIVGCRNCLDVCPTGAIVPDGDHVAIDPYICIGHGACASVCPTGAVAFDLPAGDGVFARLRMLVLTYLSAGGAAPVLLIHDPEFGDETISAIARTGRGLPAHVLPFAIAEITAVGLDLLLTALAYGVAQVLVIASPQHRDALAPLRRHAGMIDAVFSGLGFEPGRMIIDDGLDPAGLETALYAAPPQPVAPAKYAVIGDKRTTLRLALTHLHAAAPRPAEMIPLPDGAPFGLVALDANACTLCLACVGACPTGALGDNPERPQLSFLEVNCVQCGLCRATCPERAISLVPRLNFAAASTRKIVLKEEEPFACARCGKPFGVRTTIERMIERLAGHSMFAAPGRLDLLKLCEDCRVAAQFEAEAPMASKPRQPPRTADDYRRGPGGAKDDPE